MTEETKTETPPQTLTVWPHILKAMSHLASNDPSRYILNAVCVDLVAPNEHYVIATNGRLIGIYAAEGEIAWTGKYPQQFIFPMDYVKRLPAKRALAPHTLTVDLHKGKFTTPIHWPFDHTFATFPFVHGNYPSYWQVIPETEPQPLRSFPFDPALALQFSKALRILWSKEAGIELWSHGELLAYEIRTGCPNFYGLLMPLRWSSPPAQFITALRTSKMPKPSPETPETSCAPAS